MARYFFDIDDGEHIKDNTGAECVNLDAARDIVMASLPDVAYLIRSTAGDNQAVTLVVRDKDDRQVYTGTLTFTGSRYDEAASS